MYSTGKIMPRKRRHSFNEIETPQKLKRTLSDSNIFSSKKSPYQEIKHYHGTIKKFATDYYITEFILNNAISFPEEKLKEIFSDLINNAYKKTNIYGRQVS